MMKFEFVDLPEPSKMSLSGSLIGPHYEAYNQWGGGMMMGGGGGPSPFGNSTVADKVTPDMLHLIDPHWYQYPPMNPLWHGILGFVIAVLGIIAVVGNGMVLYIFCSTKSLRTPSNMFIINLAFSDFGIMFTMSPPMVSYPVFIFILFSPHF